MEVSSTSEFDKWFEFQEVRIRTIIDERVSRIEEFNHFGSWRPLGNRIAELKWKRGIRVYFSRIATKHILLIWGGFKNGQKKDIKKAKEILERYVNS